MFTGCGPGRELAPLGVFMVIRLVERNTRLPSVSANCCGSGVKKWFLKTLAQKCASVSELHKDLIKSADSRVPSHTFNQNLCVDVSF